MKLKILSFDGEMLPSLTAMPNPEFSPIMLLSFAGNYEILNGKKKVIFILNRNKSQPEGLEVKEDHVRVRFNDERRLIKGWETLIRECDVIAGYNISGFDIPYIFDRAKVIGAGQLKIGNNDKSVYYNKHLSKGLSVVKIGNVTGKILFDVLYLLRRSDESNTIKKEYNLKSLKLEWTAKEVLKKEKKDFSIKEMIEYWEKGTNEEKFINYCSVDSELALEFITKFRLLDKFITLSRYSGKLTQDIIDSQGFGSLVENLLIKEFIKHNRVIPCRPKSSNVDTEEDELAGAFVLEPKLGITDHLGSADYTSLYPTLMRKNNICYITVILDNTIPDDDTMIIVKNDEDKLMGRFVKPEILKGIIPGILEYLMTERASLKTEMKKYEKGSIQYLMYDASQNATKILLNSHYGYTGEQGAKLYCYQVASSVTGSGRKQIKYTIGMIDNKSVTTKNGKTYALTVNASDTDSVYIKITPQDINQILNREIVVECVTQVIDKVNMTLEKPMKLAFENYIRRMLVTAKKRYTMITIDEKGKESTVNKGVESVRRDWSDFSTDAMKIATDIILHEDKIDIGINKVVNYIRDEADKLKNGNINLQKLVLSKKLTKPITLYDNKAIHVQVAIRMKNRGKPSEVGDRIQFLVLNNGKTLINEKAEEAEYVMANPSICKVDYDYYINKQLFPPIIRMLEVIGSSGKLLSLDKKQKLLSEM